MEFNKRFKELRKEMKMSQIEIGKRINIAQSTITSYENGLALPSAETLITIAKTFNVSIDYLLGLTDHKAIFEGESNMDLANAIELMRPKIKGIPVSDEQWDMISLVLATVVKLLEAEGKLPKN